MKEEIFIEGQSLDLIKGQTLSFELESNILKKVDDLSCCYSYTYTLPSTSHNRSVLGDLLRIGRENANRRKFLQAEYYRDGLLIFNGNCYVDNATTAGIEVRFLFGIVNGLQRMKDEGRSLTDLFNDSKAIEDDVMSNYRNYTDQEKLDYKVAIPWLNSLSGYIQTYPYEYQRPTSFFVQKCVLGNNAYLNAALRPAVNLKRIFELIDDKYGVTFDTTFNKQAIWIQTSDRRRKDNFKLKTSNYINTRNMRFAGGEWEAFATFSSSWMAENVSGIANLSQNDHGGRMEKEIQSDYASGSMEETTFYPFINITMPYTVEAIYVYAENFSTASGSVRYYPAFDDDGENVYEEIARWESTTDRIGAWFYPKKHAMKTDFDAGDGPTIMFKTNASLTIGSMEVQFICTLKGEEVEASWFNSIDCLPDMKLTDFLTDVLFGTDGAFPINSLKGGKEILCRSLEDISQSVPVDWSKKVQAGSVKVYDNLDSLCKKNYFTFAKGDLEWDDKIEVRTNDESLEEEGDWYASGFGRYHQPNHITAKTGADARWYRPSAKICSVDNTHVYMREENGTWQYFATLKNENMRWLEYENEFKKVMEAPCRVECTIKISSLDLATLDLSRPVYLEQFGANFFISKLSVGEDTADAVLVKL